MRTQSQLERPVSCPVCDTANDRFYTYCRNCLQTLPTRPAAGG